MSDATTALELQPDEPVTAWARVYGNYPNDQNPPLLSLLMAWGVYAASSCKCREDRMVAIYRMIEKREYTL